MTDDQNTKDMRTSCRPPGERSGGLFPWPPSCRPQSERSYQRDIQIPWPPTWPPPTLPWCTVPLPWLMPSPPDQARGIKIPWGPFWPTLPGKSIDNNSWSMVPWTPPWCPSSYPDKPEPWWWIAKDAKDLDDPFWYFSLIPEKIRDQIYTWVQKEMESRTVSPPENQEELMLYTNSIISEMILKFGNSDEGRRLLNEVRAHGENDPSFRSGLGIAIASAAAIGAAVGFVAGTLVARAAKNLWRTDDDVDLYEYFSLIPDGIKEKMEIWANKEIEALILPDTENDVELVSYVMSMMAEKTLKFVTSKEGISIGQQLRTIEVHPYYRNGWVIVGALAGGFFVGFVAGAAYELSKKK
ncbi:hypothetical protein MKY48_08575 [Paenibacillus sp. FSL W8-0187]|uniref:hypothetical protein n=1 Tax=Paenibacillus sp. FSL W8-0187 TaxID=2921710 RepID=UPI0030DB51E9